MPNPRKKRSSQNRVGSPRYLIDVLARGQFHLSLSLYCLAAVFMSGASQTRPGRLSASNICKVSRFCRANFIRFIRIQPTKSPLLT